MFLRKVQYPWYVNLAFVVWLLAMLVGVITAAVPDIWLPDYVQS